MTETVWIRGNYQRDYAKRLIDTAVIGSSVKVSGPRRSIPQNDRLWAMIGDIANAKPQGRDMSPEDWKCVFMHTLGKATRWQPSLDGREVVNVGYHSSKLTKAEFSDLFLVIEQFAAENGITFTNEGI